MLRIRIRKPRTVPFVAAAAAVLIASAPLAGQSGDEELRTGFHFSIGAGAASVSADCSSCETDFFENRVNGFSGYLRFGGAVTPRLVLAGEGAGWIRNDAPIYRRIAALSVVLLGYPSVTSGFFVKSGAGVLRGIVEDDFFQVVTDGFVTQLGVGYDASLGNGIAITGYVTLLRTFGAVTEANGFVLPVAVTPNAIQLGTAITVP